MRGRAAHCPAPAHSRSHAVAGPVRRSPNGWTIGHQSAAVETPDASRARTCGRKWTPCASFSLAPFGRGCGLPPDRAGGCGRSAQRPFDLSGAWPWRSFSAAPDPWAGLSVQRAGISGLGRKRGPRAGSAAKPISPTRACVRQRDHARGAGLDEAICRISSRAPDSLSSREALSPAAPLDNGVQFRPGDALRHHRGWISCARPGSAAARSTPAMQSTASSPARAQCRRSGTFGVGVNYRITSNFSMGVEAIVHTNPGSGPFAPWP